MVPYQELIGSLLFLSNVSRPDITFAVNYLSKFNNNPGKQHWVAAKRILRFLKGTIDYKLAYTKDSGGCEFTGYSDSDFGADVDERKSVSGYVFVMAGGAVSWSSKKQTTVALSTAEAEYMALSSTIQECMWLKKLQEELLKKSLKIRIYCDNQSTIFMSTNHAYSPRTKHIDIRHHYIRECLEDNTINLEYMPTEEMVADCLTKALPNPKIKKFQLKMGLTK